MTDPTLSTGTPSDGRWPDEVSPVEAAVADRIRRHGPQPFDEVMRAALYDPVAGFYSTGGGAGRRGDFITSPEVGPLFGAVVARALDDCWVACGRPDPFVVVEAGAGRGALARSVLAAAPGCASALTYVMVEQSAALRDRHVEHLEVSLPALAFPPAGDVRSGDTASADVRGTGPRFVSLGDLPMVPFVGAVIANELLDNFPCQLVEWRDGRWCEIRVGLGHDDRTLVEFAVEASDELRAAVSTLVPAPVEGARVPIQRAAAHWLRRARGLVERGALIAFDYTDTTVSLAGRSPEAWLRTYRSHERGGTVLADLGSQDITCEVAIDQLRRAVPPDRIESQADFLRRHGIDELVDEGRRVWAERAAIGDLAAIRGRSRVSEAEALLDPTGLGAFSVITWLVP